VGYPVGTEEVLATAPVRDEWQVLGIREESYDDLTTRRVWLRGTGTGRPALVLSFAAPGQPLAADLVLATTLDADLHFYPGAQPLRALLGTRHAPAMPSTGAAGGTPVEAALRGYAVALAADPWLDQWPILLDAVTPAVRGNRWHLVDRAGDGLLVTGVAGVPWRLVAVAGGRPVTVAGEWSPEGLRPLTAWLDGRPVPL
jgi:hypothetical protein